MFLRISNTRSQTCKVPVECSCKEQQSSHRIETETPNSYSELFSETKSLSRLMLRDLEERNQSQMRNNYGNILHTYIYIYIKSRGNNRKRERGKGTECRNLLLGKDRLYTGSHRLAGKMVYRASI